MKNVVVLYHHNLSAAYLKDENLNDSHGIAPNIDSSDILQALSDPEGQGLHEYYQDQLKGLQTKDGIQFHHPKHLKPMASEYSDSDTSIAPFMDELEQYVAKRGETIDAVVMPYAFDQASSILWAKELKAKFPNIKILVTDCSLAPLANASNAERERATRFAIPRMPEGAITNGIRHAVIHAGDPGYDLAEGIDAVTKNADALMINNTLRDLLGMEHLQAKALPKGRSA